MNSKKLQFILSIGFILSVWELLSRLVFNIHLIPPISSIFIYFLKMIMSREMFTHLAASLQRLFIGYVTGSTIGILIGCGIGRIKLINEILNPLIKLSNSTPAIALIPISILWFGVGEMARYFLIIYASGLIVTLNSAEGVRAVHPIHLRVARCLGTDKVRIFPKVIIPSSFPYIMAGLKTALGISIMVLVAAEMLGASSGVGYLIIQARINFDINRMFVGIIMLGLLCLLFDRIFGWLISKKLSRFDVAKRI